jgi:inositol transport system permease protein
VIAAIFHIVLRYTRFGKSTYAMGANRQAARVSGINVKRHLVYSYTIAGLLSGQSGSGVMYELFYECQSATCRTAHGCVLG